MVPRIESSARFQSGLTACLSGVGGRESFCSNEGIWFLEREYPRLKQRDETTASIGILDSPFELRTEG